MRKKLMWYICTSVLANFMMFFGFGHATDFPTKSIEILAPWGMSGSSGVSLKFVGDGVSKLLGKPVLIIPAPGAAGTIAAARVSRAKPDGHTLLLANSATNGSSFFLIKDVPYSNADFEFIAEFGAIDLGLVVKPNSPFKTLDDFVAFAKKNPSAIKCGTGGRGGSDDLAREFLAMEAPGVKIPGVPFKTPFEKRAAVIGGHIDSAFIYGGTGGSGDEFRRTLEGGGNLLAVATKERLKPYPNVPTFKERGFDVVLSGWYGIAGPKGIPREVSQKLKEALYKVLRETETGKFIENAGLRYEFRDSEEFAKFVKEWEKLVERIIKGAGIQPE